MKALSRILLLLMAALLVIFSVPVALAADVDADDLSVYVLHHNVSDDDYDGPNLQYFSPYVTDYIYDGAPSYIQSNIFSLYNTVNKEVIPTYCTDIKVGALPDHRYRRLNLEDSSYAAGAAGHLRAIVRNGFYIVPRSGESEADHAVRVAEKLKALGQAAGVEDLTIGEAISGTQTAIWQAAHGSILEYTDFVRTIYTTKMPSATKYYDLCNEERENGHIDYTVSTYGQVNLDPDCDARLNARIKAVYDYLLSLEPMEAVEKTVSAASFIKLSEPVRQMNADGTYDITVQTTVDVDMADGDYLTLHAYMGDAYSKSTTLEDGKQSVTLTLENVPAEIAESDAILTIEGMQTASEVFLYDAYGDRETAQSMIGMDDSQLPVRASVVANTDRILNFYKTTLVAEGSENYVRYPLEGITFDIFFVATMSDYLTGKVTLPDASEYPYPDLAEHVVITDQNGRASMNFTQHGLPDGVYLIVERVHPAIKQPVDPFYVFVPSTKADGTGYEYEITVQPKNEIKGSVSIDKDVTFIGNDESTVDAYANHTWIISTNVPEDISGGKSFVVSDTLDNRLDYVGNMKVNVESADGKEVLATLTEGTDYIVSVNDVDSLSEDKPSDSFEMSLTRAGMGKIAKALNGKGFDGYRLRVYFDAQINANAQVGTQIPNQASLKYTNSVNFDFNVESDQPVVNTGAVNLLKVDADHHDWVLPGSVFEIYRHATEAEVGTGENLFKFEGISAPMVKVAFFDHAAMTGQKVTSVTTDGQGRAAIYGLAYGTYYLVETKSPDGYNLLKEPVQITIDENSHTEERVITVENHTGSILPSTGGIGTTVFTVSGIAVLAMGCLLLWLKRKDFLFVD